MEDVLELLLWLVARASCAGRVDVRLSSDIASALRGLGSQTRNGGGASTSKQNAGADADRPDESPSGMGLKN